MRLLERDEPLAELRGLLDEAGQGSGRVVLVRGEAGIGKTSLVRRFADDVVDQAHVLWGSCDDLVTPIPLGAVRDMANEEPTLNPALGSDDRNAVFQELLHLLDRGLRPTVMVIEDIHWADDATLDLIRFLGRRIGRTRGLLVLTYRDGENPGDDSLRALLGGLPHGALARITLQPLTRDAVATLLPADIDTDDVLVLTGGNPFFVSEIAATPGSTVPPSIRDSVIARVGRLSDEVRQVLEVVAVSPTGLELDVLAKIVGDARSEIQEGEQSGVLRVEAGWVRFRHELARRAVEGDLSEIARRELNREVLNALEASNAGLVRRAHHAREAGEIEAMLRILPDAATRSASLGSTQEALAMLDAIEPHIHLLSPEELADVYDTWYAQAFLAERDDTVQIAERAIALRRELGDPVKLGRTLGSAGRIAGQRLDPVAAEWTLEAVEVLEAVGADGEDLAAAYNAMASRAIFIPDYTKVIEYSEKALRAAGESTSINTIRALNSLGIARAFLAYPEGMEDLAESYRLATDLGLHAERARAAGNANVLHWTARNLEEAARSLDLGLTVLEEADLPATEIWLRIAQAWVAYARGDWTEAVAVVLTVLDAPDVSPRYRINAETLLAVTQIRRGAPDARTRFDNLWRNAEESKDFTMILGASIVAAEYAWHLGDASVIQPAVYESLERAWDAEMVTEGGEMAQWLYLGGHIDHVPEKAPEPYRYLSGGDWESAAEYWRKTGFQYEYAVALAHGGAEARLQALTLLDGFGALPLATKIRRGLQAEGVKGVPRGPYRGRRESPLGLTARQTEILDLIADGKTNAEIADHLFLSVRTVEHHVSAIMTTLGASNRSDAVRLATQ